MGFLQQKRQTPKTGKRQKMSVSGIIEMPYSFSAKHVKPFSSFLTGSKLPVPPQCSTLLPPVHGRLCHPRDLLISSSFGGATDSSFAGASYLTTPTPHQPIKKFYLPIRSSGSLTITTRRGMIQVPFSRDYYVNIPWPFAMIPLQPGCGRNHSRAARIAKLSFLYVP